MGMGSNKHELYVAVFDSHLFNDLFVQSRGKGHGSLGHWIRYCNTDARCEHDLKIGNSWYDKHISDFFQ